MKSNQRIEHTSHRFQTRVPSQIPILFQIQKNKLEIEITSQNHSYAVDERTLEKTTLVPTHKNILDNTIEGVECKEDKVFSVQYHPESAPGPQDSDYLFDKFIKIMEKK